jgi:hypothetical protein
MLSKFKSAYDLLTLEPRDPPYCPVTSLRNEFKMLRKYIRQSFTGSGSLRISYSIVPLILGHREAASHAHRYASKSVY